MTLEGYFFQEDIDSLEQEILKLREQLQGFVKQEKQFSLKSLQLKVWKELIQQEIGMSVEESLHYLDSYHLYLVLIDTLSNLQEKLENIPLGEDQHHDAEIRAIQFLYKLVRFVVEKKHFPTTHQQKRLFSGNLTLEDLGNYLSQSEKLSPQIRKVKRKMRKQAMHNTVGIGGEQEDESYQRRKLDKLSNILFSHDIWL